MGAGFHSHCYCLWLETIKKREGVVGKRVMSPSFLM